VLPLTFAGLTILPDGTPLIAVVETVRVWRWFRYVEVSQTRSYCLKAGLWWGEHGALSKRDPRHAQLCDLAMRDRVRASVDQAIV
jgi:hypothetical protein